MSFQQPNAANRTPNQGNQAIDKAQDKAGQIAGDVREKTGEVTEQAKQTAKNALTDQKGRAAESVESVAQALRQTGKHLSDRDQAGFGGFVTQTADRLDRLSDDIQNKSIDEMVDSVEQFAHRDPQLFLGGAVVLGLLAARFLKSSGERRQSRQQPNRQQPQYRQQPGNPGTSGSRPAQWSTGQGYAGGFRQGANEEYRTQYSNTYDKPVDYSPESLRRRTDK